MWEARSVIEGFLCPGNMGREAALGLLNGPVGPCLSQSLHMGLSCTEVPERGLGGGERKMPPLLPSLPPPRKQGAPPPKHPPHPTPIVWLSAYPGSREMLAPLWAGTCPAPRASYLIEVSHILTALQDPGVEGLPWWGKEEIIVSPPWTANCLFKNPQTLFFYL